MQTFLSNEAWTVILRVRVDAEQDLVQFSVIDTSIGIASEDLARLFTPFVQVDSSLNHQFEGTGLGLSLVQKLTDLHSTFRNLRAGLRYGYQCDPAVGLKFVSDIRYRRGRTGTTFCVRLKVTPWTGIHTIGPVFRVVCGMEE